MSAYDTDHFLFLTDSERVEIYPCYSRYPLTVILSSFAYLVA